MRLRKDPYVKNEAKTKDEAKATQSDGAPKKLKLKTSSQSPTMDPPYTCNHLIL